MAASAPVMECDVAVVGAGPAGLMAADVISAAGFDVAVFDAMPSVGRKFLMAGKSGLNLTKAEPMQQFLAAYAGDTDWLAPMLKAFGPEAVQDWARGLDQVVFTGSTGRVFPKAMKASPLLRAWLARLQTRNVQVFPRWRWCGWQGDALRFDTPAGPHHVAAQKTVLALGGASWRRLGSDGAWASVLKEEAVPLSAFEASNAGLAVDWSDHMQRHFGKPLKNVAFQAGQIRSRGEVILSQTGIEGGGIYTLSPAIRAAMPVTLDLKPDWEALRLETALATRRSKESLANHLRKALRLNPAQIALLNEWGRPLPSDPAALGGLIKALPVRHAGLRPIDEAISTTGGVRRDALDETLMLKARPGTYCVGEMLDWDAPTGGYLISACLATGRWAGLAAVEELRRA